MEAHLEDVAAIPEIRAIPTISYPKNRHDLMSKGRPNSVNSKVDKLLNLEEIPSLADDYQSKWKIRTLSVGGKNEAKKLLIDWQKKRPGDFKKILKVMRLVGTNHRVKDPNKVKPSANPKHVGAYEMIAKGDVARLMFFYYDEGSIVICAAGFEKGKGDQDSAFNRCHTLRELFLKHYQP